MPIEIRELIIRAVAVDDNDVPGRPSASVVGSFNTNDIVQKCVEEVLEILERKEAR